jgi:HPt (histidine-containing phosphotransfer) domain-containing protein
VSDDRAVPAAVADLGVPIPVDVPLPLDSPLETGRLDALRELGGGAEVLAQVIELYLRELPSRSGALDDAVRRADPSALEFAAHRLKGASGTLGAERLALLCSRLEQLGRSGSCEGTAELLDDLHRELERVRVALAAELARPSATP